jgi:flagellar assembly protein FliH
MAIIKNSTADTAAREALVLDLGDLQKMGTQIVVQARAKADQILAEAKAERERTVAGAAEAGRVQGFEQGLGEGRRAGEQQARAAAAADSKQRFEALAAAWERALGQFSSERDAMVTAAQRDVLELALRIARLVTKRAVEVDPAVAQAQLEALLAIVVRPTELVVSVHPSDRATLADAAPQLLAKFPAVRHVDFVDDPALTPGSCVARLRGEDAGHAGGEIDASIDTQIQRIVEALFPASGKRP